MFTNTLIPPVDALAPALSPVFLTADKVMTGSIYLVGLGLNGLHRRLGAQIAPGHGLAVLKMTKIWV